METAWVEAERTTTRELEREVRLQTPAAKLAAAELERRRVASARVAMLLGWAS